MNAAAKDIRSFHPLPTRSDEAFADRPRVDVGPRKQVKAAVRRLTMGLTRTARHKVSFETIVNLLLWAVELYVVAFLLKLFLG